MAKISSISDLCYVLLPKICQDHPVRVRAIGGCYLFKVVNAKSKNISNSKWHCAFDANTATLITGPDMEPDWPFNVGIEISEKDFAACLNNGSDHGMNLWYSGKIRI